MAGETKPSALGFLTVIENPQWGLIGGYLLLNAAGRPLEFHCTAPVKPNRAQQILYGPTLEPYLYGEQIGRTLVEKGQKPLAVLTDVAPALALREHVPMPVALVMLSESNDERGLRVDAAHALPRPAMTQFRLGENKLAVPAMRSADREQLQSRLAGIGESLDLAEPFSRIREAIEESQRGAR